MERRDFIKEMQELAAAGGTDVPPPVISADEIMNKDKPVENDFSAALMMAEESIAAVATEAEFEEEEEDEASIMSGIDELEKNFVPERWIVNLNEVRRPIARILVFPGIGQSHMFYRKWGEFFTLSDIALHAICLPGRSFRVKERNAGAVEAARYIVQAIDAYFENKSWRKDPPLLLFGHCLGAIVAFEVAKHYNELFDDAKPTENVLICHLVASSCKGPTALDEYNQDRYSKKWWVQSDSDIMDRAATLGGVPTILRDKNRRDLLRSFVPCIREDFKALEKYIYVPMERKSVEDRGSIDCPVTTICCKDDKAQQFEEVSAWEQCTDYGTNPGQVNSHHAMILGGHSWPLLSGKEDALKEFLERLCAHYVQEREAGKALALDFSFEEPVEDEEELERVVETFYGLP